MARCSGCGGRGKVRCVKTIFDPEKRKHVKCPECNGSGSAKCFVCGGSGREGKDKKK